MPNGKPRDGVAPNRLGSKARCDALVDKAHSIWKKDPYVSPRDFYFVLTARYSKDNYENPDPSELLGTLSDQMMKYVTENSWCKIFVAKPQAWGTYEETKVSIQRISGVKNQNPKDNMEVYTSTNLGHMPRVWLCWFFLKPKGWKVHFVLAKHSFTPKEWAQETIKFFTYLYRFLFKKWEKKSDGDGGGEHHRAFR